MAFRLDPSLPVDAEIRRVLREQLRKAARELRSEDGPDAEAVHDARKRIKKARSTLRLARADFGAGVVRHANDELRAVGTSLAAQREADALVESVDQLAEWARSAADRARAGAPDPDAASTAPGAEVDDDGDDGEADRDEAFVPGAELAPALGRLRAGLAARADALRGEAVDAQTARSAARRLEQLATWLDRVPPRERGWDGIGVGLARQHRRGHRARAVVLAVERPDQPSFEDLHEWRKRVKDLWYHERLLRRLWPEAQAPWVAAAGELADLLGTDHDLALLVELLSSAAPADHADDDIDRIVEAAEQRRAELQARARDLGALLYAEDGEAWEARHRVWWRARA